MKKTKAKTAPKPRVKRPCNSVNLCKPNQSTSLRTILDRVNAGLPINCRVAQHTPLPPDGEDLDDFERGTEEILDLVDAQKTSEKVQQWYDEQKQKQQQQQDDAKQKQFDDAVAAKVAEELAKANTSNDA